MMLVCCDIPALSAYHVPQFHLTNVQLCTALSQSEVGITEIFRDLEQYRMIAFGGAMVLIMIFKPKGILANRKPTIVLKDYIK